MEVQIQPTFRDLAEFNGVLPKLKLVRLMIFLTALFCLGTTLYVRSPDGHAVARWPAYLLVAALCIFAWATPFIAAFRPWMVMRKASFRVRVEETGVELHGAAGELSHPWNFYRRMKVTPNLYVLFAPTVEKSLFLPKRSFVERGQQERFEALVRRHLP